MGDSKIQKNPGVWQRLYENTIGEAKQYWESTDPTKPENRSGLPDRRKINPEDAQKMKKVFGTGYNE